VVYDVIYTFASYILQSVKISNKMAYVTRGVGGRGQVLVNEGFRFHRNTCTQEKIRWRCFRKDCRSYLTTRKFDIDDVNAVITVLKVNVSCLLNFRFTVC